MHATSLDERILLNSILLVESYYDILQVHATKQSLSTWETEIKVAAM